MELHDQISTIAETGSGVLADGNFAYTALDNCLLPLSVEIDIFTNEEENFNAQEMALFYNKHGDLTHPGIYVYTSICSTGSNGQCIKDPVVPQRRIYTAVVTATDAAGNAASSQCQLVIADRKRPPPIASSTQRIFVDSYAFVLEDYA